MRSKSPKAQPSKLYKLTAVVVILNLLPNVFSMPVFAEDTASPDVTFSSDPDGTDSGESRGADKDRADKEKSDRDKSDKDKSAKDDEEDPEVKARREAWKALDRQAREALAKGELDTAEQLWKDAIDAAEKAQPPQVEPGVVQCLIGEAMVYDKRGNFFESERLYELAMRNMEALYGGLRAPRLADFLDGLGDLYFRHGRTDQAEVTYKHLLDVRETANPLNKEKLAQAYEAYARFLRKAQRPQEAVVMDNKAQAVRTRPD